MTGDWLTFSPWLHALPSASKCMLEGVLQPQPGPPKALQPLQGHQYFESHQQSYKERSSLSSAFAQQCGDFICMRPYTPCLFSASQQQKEHVPASPLILSHTMAYYGIWESC